MNPKYTIYTPKKPKNSLNEVKGLSSIDKMAKRGSEAFCDRKILNTLEKQALMPCTNPRRPTLVGKDPKTKQALFCRVKCKMWSCPSCAARRARKIIAHVLRGIDEVGGNWYFATLTAHEKMRGTEASYKNIQDGWHKIRKRVTYEYGDFLYYGVLEPHKDGSLHLHLIMNAPIPTKERTNHKGEKYFTSKWWKDTARECGMGYIADYQPMRSKAGAAVYVAKYMTKEATLDGFEFPKNCNRARHSQAWAKLDTWASNGKMVWAYIKDTVELHKQLAQAIIQDYRLYYGKSAIYGSSRDVIRWFVKSGGGFYDWLGMRIQTNQLERAIKDYEQRSSNQQIRNNGAT